mmetsp:Transcript_41339/g.96654  ORF Transcript_41339/g.96654 Transcript_41339/m.96654 type:complete len:237 (-) Transcript_41339:1164-1874(-)
MALREVDVLLPPLGKRRRLVVKYASDVRRNGVRDRGSGASRARSASEVMRAVSCKAARMKRCERLAIGVRAVLCRKMAERSGLKEHVFACLCWRKRLYILHVQIWPVLRGESHLPPKRLHAVRAVDQLVVVDVEQVSQTHLLCDRDDGRNVRRLPVHLLKVVALGVRAERRLNQHVPGRRRKELGELGRILDSDVEALDAKHSPMVLEPSRKVDRPFDHANEANSDAIGQSDGRDG